MDRYVIGASIDGIEKIELGEQASSIKDSLVVVVLSNESNGKLYSYYSSVRELIVNGNRVILILDGNTSRIRKQISMLLASYRCYDIYTTDDVQSITSAYIDILEGRQPTEREVEQFIGSDITSYSEINEIMLKLASAVSDEDADTLRQIVEDNKENIENFADIIDYMKKIVDKVNSGDSDKESKQLRDRLHDLEDSLNAANEKLDEAARNAEIAKEEQAMLRKEAFKAKKRTSELEEKLNNREPVIKAYTEVQTQQIRCRVKVVIYFKEVTHISYISSMIMKFIEALTLIHKLRVKLVIYDNKTGFLGNYKPIPIIGSSEYVSNRDIIVNKYDKIVAVDANQALIEEILTSDWDVVIVYDRLKQLPDIVSGNNVYKYWVMNSLSEYNALKAIFSIDKSRIITRPGVLLESLTISEIRDYKTHTSSAKLADYMNMRNLGSNDGKVFDQILSATNIKALQGRGRG